jgi:hypothetical protein
MIAVYCYNRAELCGHCLLRNVIQSQVTYNSHCVLNALSFTKTSANLSHAFVKAVLERDDVSVVILMSENFIGGES